jgi:hypothetical protein
MMFSWRSCRRISISCGACNAWARQAACAAGALAQLPGRVRARQLLGCKASRDESKACCAAACVSALSCVACTHAHTDTRTCRRLRMSLSDFPCFRMNFMAVIWPVQRRRPL